MENKITNNNNFRGYTLQENNKYNYYTITLDQITNQVEYSISAHSKVLFMRMDIHNPQVTNKKQIQRKDMTRILENTKRIINKRYKESKNKPDMQYTWTSENDGKDHKTPHYHLAISVNGNAVKNCQPVFEALNKATMKHLGTTNPGLVHYSKGEDMYYGGFGIDRNAPDFKKNVDKAVKLGSYLAKTHTKEDRPKGSRISSSSKLPKGWETKKNNVFGSEVKTMKKNDLGLCLVC